MKINILDKSVYNRIAAGEVVERPFSVIKELTENAIDAGAKNIKISIWNGGKDRVEIEDDGCGIEKDELNKALLPHATSKIKDVKDLDSILTLGFRGEALASIASVSKLTIVSKPREQEFGAKIYCEGGVISEVTDYPSNDGTKITVDDLFFNTPVRAKFLKTTRAEEGDITDIVGRLILANPEISFKYYANEKLVLQSFGGGEEEALISVYGTEAVKSCFRIETIKNGIYIKGYIGRHFFTKPNRTYQTLIINGRYVINQTVSSAIHNAYQSYLMKRQYPFFVLSLSLPADAVDVNVHPNKTEVRFNNNQVVYGSLYSVVSKVLDGSNDAINIVKSDGKELASDNLSNTSISEEFLLHGEKNQEVIDENIAAKITEENKDSNAERNKFTPPKHIGSASTSPRRTTVFLGEDFSEKTKEDEEREKRAEDTFLANKKFLEELDRKVADKKNISDAESRFLAAEEGKTIAVSQSEEKDEEIIRNCNSNIESNKIFENTKENIFSKASFADSASSENTTDEAVIANEQDVKINVASNSLVEKTDKQEETIEMLNIQKSVLQSDLGIEKDFVYIGQAFKTYLIFQRGEELYFVDQHAAHERILFDALYDRAVNGQKVTQPLLIPYVLNLNSVESQYFLSRKGYLEEIGFVIDEFGYNCFKITEVPIETADMNLQAFFADFLSDNSLKQEKVPELIREKLCQRACKAAIKAGYDLSKSEIDALLRKMKGNMGLKCPHGRPVAVRITQTEIEKWFKRIV